ncbi:MAG TPA: hypothetical protein VLG92_01875 [Candidatus Saccharimonadia bacterium]|nr:hypothetical protein [Candidatus Saccharimonadia bacterium]
MAEFRLPDHSEKTGEAYPMLNLGDDLDARVRRDIALQRYRDFIDGFNPTDDPLADIREIRRLALRPYVEAALPRMRIGEVVRVHVPEGVVSYDALYPRLEEANGHSFRGLALRVCSSAPERINTLLETGTDRNRQSGVNNLGKKAGDGTYEEKSMRAFGFDGQYEEVTYARTPYSEADEKRYPYQPFYGDDALLVYAPEALQTLSHEGADPYQPPFGFMGFIDPALRMAALLAIVDSNEPS